ncbi:MAG: membrane-bound lytic murein transglycosylase MltF [Acidiferrobacterales bacterium]
MSFFRDKQKIFYASTLVLSLILLSACSEKIIGEKALQSIKEKKQLIVVTRNSPTTYYELHDEWVGFEHDMAQAFAEYLGVKVRFIEKESTAEIISAITNGEAHIAAAGLTKTKERGDQFLFGPVYQKVQQQVVCRNGGKRPKNINGLSGVQLLVPKNTSYEEKLIQLKQKYKKLEWQTGAGLTSENLLEQVWSKKLDCTVADSNIVAINRRYYPELSVRFNLTKPESLAWLLSPKSELLQQEINKWFNKFKKSGQLSELNNRYYGFIEIFDFVDTRAFVRSIEKDLPLYRDMFKQAATKNDLQWMQIAAQAYQESRWRVNAKSPTGVRGIMMLTRNTARGLGVKNRLDPAQSISGGARYYADLYQRLPESIKEPDRSWYALAAYNIGMGHIYDARTLARQLKKNPDLWQDLSKVLPLLANKNYYPRLKHGYARGREPVRYVRRIRDYQDILEKTLSSR